MRVVVLDFETFFSDEFTLSRMTTEAYIRDPRFIAHGAAIKWSAQHAARWYDERALRQVLKEEDWSDVLLVSHHAQFDHFILSHHYAVHPRMSGCTLSMARLLLGNHIGVSLDSVREQYGLPAKRTPYHLFKGKHWDEIPADHQRQIADGCCDEVESIWKLFGLLAKEFPAEEYETVHHTVRMFTEPSLAGDIELLGKLWEKENADKSKRLADLAVSTDALQSSNRFADLLRAEGVEPETKTSPTGQTIYQFAKTDPFMQELLEDEDDRVRGLAEARLGAKSTLLQTRAETLGWMARRGPLCVYLRMYGAHTTRWSGGDKSNFQNFKKDDPEYPREKGGLNIRDAILPPSGYLLVKPDASQIECRLLNFISGQDDVIERFRNGEDPYVNVASQFYGYPVNKRDHPAERQVGKVLELQAGYGSGGPKIVSTLRAKAGILLTPEEGVRARDAYRNTHPQNVSLWKECGRMLSRLAGGPPTDWRLGCGRLSLPVRDGRIYLPNGCPMIYTIEFHRDPETGDEYWRRKTRRGWMKIHGPLLTENIIQGLARVVISRAFIRIARLGYRVVGTEHDSLWVLVPQDGQEDRHVRQIHDEMVRTPEWLPGIPLDCEVH